MRDAFLKLRDEESGVGANGTDERGYSSAMISRGYVVA